MKRILLAMVAIALIAPLHSQNKYTIKGSVATSELDGKKVYLQVIDSTYAARVKVDSATVQNKSFVIEGKTASVRVAFITPQRASKAVRPASLILEKGDITVVLDSVSLAKGTALNAELERLIEAEATVDSEETMNAYKKTLFNFINTNIKNQVGEYIFMANQYMFDTDELQVILPAVSDELKKTPKFKKIEKRYEALTKSKEGMPFIDLKGKTPQSNEIALSDYAGKGKYVLLDFWATWCGPCRKEMPNLVEAYGKYKDKGLEIVGVSLDNDAKAWADYLTKANMTWPQLSDLKGWDSQPASLYGVMSIPSTVLIDKDGKIIAKNLMGEALFDKLSEIFE